MTNTKIQTTDGGLTVTISPAMGRALTGALEHSEEAGEAARLISVRTDTQHALIRRGLAEYEADIVSISGDRISANGHVNNNVRLTGDGIRAAKQLQNAETEPKQNPYDADHVVIVEEPGSITAVWIADPEKAKDPKAVLDAPPFHESINDYEIVAEASRFYKVCGADFSGWIVTSRNNYSTEPIPTRKAALADVKLLIADYFNR